jgi:hypothetical protein
LAGVLKGTPAVLLPPAATKAMNSASRARSGFVGSKKPASLRLEFSSVAKPVVPGKKTPIPPTSWPFLKIGIPPGSVPIPRDWASGNRPETNP